MLILDPPEYHRVKPLLEGITFNSFFAQMVLKMSTRGTVYVDVAEKPATALIMHPYGMLLLCGRSDNSTFNKELIDFMLNTRYPQALWLQVYPPIWSTQLEGLLNDRLKRYPQGKSFAEAENEFRRMNSENVVECTRVNFLLNRNKYLKGKSETNPKSLNSAPPILPKAEGLFIARMDKVIYEDMRGAVIARNFWNSYEDFAARGTGYCVLRGQEILSACFTAFVSESYYEIGIETAPEVRGQGYAGLAARAYIDHCLRNNLEPVWACRKENVGSYKLAQQLGFEVVRELPYYGLVNNMERP